MLNISFWIGTPHRVLIRLNMYNMFDWLVVTQVDVCVFENV